MAVGIGCCGYESIAVSTTAMPFTLTGLGRVNAAFVTVETNTIRVRMDGTAPTASEGHAYVAGASFWVIGNQEVRNFKAIRVSADAVIKVSYFGDVLP